MGGRGAGSGGLGGQLFLPQAWNAHNMGTPRPWGPQVHIEGVAGGGKMRGREDKGGVWCKFGFNIEGVGMLHTMDTPDPKKTQVHIEGVVEEMVGVAKRREVWAGTNLDPN